MTRFFKFLCTYMHIPTRTVPTHTDEIFNNVFLYLFYCFKQKIFISMREVILYIPTFKSEVASQSWKPTYNLNELVPIRHSSYLFSIAHTNETCRYQTESSFSSLLSIDWIYILWNGFCIHANHTGWVRGKLKWFNLVSFEEVTLDL